MAWWTALLGVLLVALAGCQAPTAPIPAAATVAVEGRVAFGYRLLGTVKAYTAADVDHVKLVLLANDGGWRETGASKAVPAAGLGAAVALGNLRADRAYRVRVDAYASATESAATLISDPVASTTDFATPAVVTTAGVASIDDAAIALPALRCQLRDRTYAGTGAFSVAVSKGLEKKITHVRLTLAQVAADGTRTSRHARTVALADAAKTFTMANLRAGASYVVVAEGLKVADGETKLSNDNQSTLAFTMPALGSEVSDQAAATAFEVSCK